MRIGIIIITDIRLQITIEKEDIGIYMKVK